MSEDATLRTFITNTKAIARNVYLLFLFVWNFNQCFQIPEFALGIVTLAGEESSVSLGCSLFSASVTLFTGVLTAGAEIEE